MLNLWTVAPVVLLLNLPFGFWRAGVRKFSFAWFLAIHAPIPVVVALRFWADLGFHWTTYPVMVGAYFAGQFLGARLGLWWGRRRLQGERA
jgi:hypothetical protein